MIHRSTFVPARPWLFGLHTAYSLKSGRAAAAGCGAATDLAGVFLAAATRFGAALSDLPGIGASHRLKC
jgi:hypothetical protein